MLDAKQEEFLREEVRRLERLHQATLGRASMLQDNVRSDHHLIIVLRERIQDLTAELKHYKDKEV